MLAVDLQTVRHQANQTAGHQHTVTATAAGSLWDSDNPGPPLASLSPWSDLTGMATHPAFDYHHLSIAERLQLVEDMWDSIAAEADRDTLPVTDQEKALLDERLVDLEANPTTGASWAEVRARIIDRPR